MIAGAIGISIANPTDVIKVRMIMNGQPKIIEGKSVTQPKTYLSTFD